MHRFNFIFMFSKSKFFNNKMEGVANIINKCISCNGGLDVNGNVLVEKVI